MTVQFVTLAVPASDGSGNGSVTDTVYRTGKILAIGLDFASGTDAGCDTTVSVDSPAGPALDLLTVSNSKTDGWFYPRGSAVTTANAAITDSEEPIPFFGKLKVTVAQAGNAVTLPVRVTIFYED